MAEPRAGSAEMPFLDHLEELRWRILYALLAFVIGVGLAFWLLLKFDIIMILERPILPYLDGRKLVYTHPGDPFAIVMRGAVALGMMLSLPVILYQLWAFVSPALYKHERRWILPVFFFATLLFATGVALAYFVVLPLAIRWLMGFQTSALEPMITAADYFDFAISMAVSFGLAFELPILVLGLAAFGVVTPMLLNRLRRHAIVVCAFAGAFLTPGDMIWTTVAMSVPLYLLYELSVVLSWFVYRRRQRRQAARDAAATPEAVA